MSSAGNKEKLPTKGFAGLRVLSFESRRQREMAQLIANNGGQPMVVASTREVPLEANAEVAGFVASLLEGKFDAVIFLTGVGVRMLAQAAESSCPREKLVEALSKVGVVARGPKPVAALRELGVPVTLTVPEPNTWREILQTLDSNAEKVPVHGKRVVVQEYGAPSTELLAGLKERGALASSVHVYRWEQPEDKEPLHSAIKALNTNEVDVVLFTSQVQLLHLLEVAEEMKIREKIVQALNRTVVASIGPTTSEALRAQGIGVDFEPLHPKMGFLVKEAADKSAELVGRKRNQEV
jgi:uroporphyrinogen-III synthase